MRFDAEKAIRSGFVFYALMTIIDGTSAHWYMRLAEFLGYEIGFVAFWWFVSLL